MKNRFSWFILLICISLSATGYSCIKSPSLPMTVKEKLKRTEIFEEHQLLGMRETYYKREPKKILAGVFIFFRWDFSSKIVGILLPYEKITFILDKRAKKPTIQFIFNPRWLNCQHCYIGNVNKIIASDELIRVIIRTKSILEIPFDPF